MWRMRCPYCGAVEGWRCTCSAAGRFVTECKSCGRVVEERRSEVEELFVERAKDSPLCIVTPDFSENENYQAPPLEDDPFESIGFITAFSTWSLELSPLFTSTCTSFSGHLAELERVLLDPVYPTGGESGDVAGANMSIADALRGYFQIVEVSSILGLERDFCDHAIQLFRDCSSTTYLKNRNIEALATAALVQAIREAQEPRTLQEISVAANIPQKEIAKYMKVLSDSLKLSQPINSNSISVHMPRFCALLQLSKATQDLATHIGEVVINKSFCTRRNPISISAAAIYLSCQLEDKRKTQTEICKATGLTEVTLRKVYKELSENLSDLLPPNYTPTVPPEKPFSVSAAALGRVCATRAPLVDSSLITTNNGSVPGHSNLTSFSVIADGTNGANSVGGDPSVLASSTSLFQAPGSLSSSSTIHPPNPWNLNGSSLDGKSTGNVFVLPSGIMNSVAPLTVTSGQLEATKRVDRVGRPEHPKDQKREAEQTKEKEKEKMEADCAPSGAQKLPPPFKGCSVVGPLDSVPAFGPPFLPFRPFMQDLPNCPWPMQALYGLPMLRPEENAPVFESGEDSFLQLGLNRPQFVGIMPPSIGDGATNVPAQIKGFQGMGLSTVVTPVEIASQGSSQMETEVVAGKESENGGHDAGGQALPQPSVQCPVSTMNFNVARNAGGNDMSPLFQGFPQALWGFNPVGPVPLSLYSPQFLAQYGGLLCGPPQVDSQKLGTDKVVKMFGMAGDGSSDSAAVSSETADTLGKGSNNAVLSSMSKFPFAALPAPFHQLYIPATNPGGIPGEGSAGHSMPLQVDTKHIEGTAATSVPPLSHFSSGMGVDHSTPPAVDLPELSMGLNSSAQTSSSVPEYC